MLKKRYFWIVFLFFIPNPLFAFNPEDKIVVSFPDIPLTKGERIVGFELVATTGTIVTIDRIPDDWSINLRAKESGNTSISGSCAHGAGGLFSSNKLPKITIQVDKPFDETVPKFLVNAKIDVTSDFEKTREIKLNFKQMVLTKKRI